MKQADCYKLRIKTSTKVVEDKSMTNYKVVKLYGGETFL